MNLKQKTSKSIQVEIHILDKIIYNNRKYKHCGKTIKTNFVFFSFVITLFLQSYSRTDTEIYFLTLTPSICFADAHITAIKMVWAATRLRNEPLTGLFDGLLTAQISLY